VEFNLRYLESLTNRHLYRADHEDKCVLISPGLFFNYSLFSLISFRLSRIFLLSPFRIKLSFKKRELNEKLIQPGQNGTVLSIQSKLVRKLLSGRGPCGRHGPAERMWTSFWKLLVTGSGPEIFSGRGQSKAL